MLQPHPTLHLPVWAHARPQVVDALYAALSSPIVVLVAATGYGKTLAALELWQTWSAAKAWWAPSRAAIGAYDLVADVRRAAEEAWRSPDEGVERLKSQQLSTGGLLVIDMADATFGEDVWHSIRQLAEAMPSHARLLMLCRERPSLPITLWHSQGRLTRLDHRTLALTNAERLAVDLQGEADTHPSLLAWWGPAEAVRRRIALTEWVADVWFPTLNQTCRAALGALGLSSRPDLVFVSAVLARDALAVDSALTDLASCCGAVEREGSDFFLTGPFRLAVSRAWRRADEHAWRDAVGRAIDYCLSRGQIEAAALIAHESGLPETIRVVLNAGGWTLLFGSGRPTLGRLLEQIADDGEPAIALLTYAWRIEALKAAHEADAPLGALLPSLAGFLRGQALALMAVIAWDYDDFARALSLSDESLALFRDDRHPASVYVRIVRANALAALGRLDDADAALRQAHACANRDDLLYLKLECLQRRAQLAYERGLATEASQRAHEVFRLAETQALPLASVIDSSRRLQSWLHLQRLERDEAEAVLGEHAFWRFPQRLYRAVFALVGDDIATARQEVLSLSRDLDERFLCVKWRNQAAQAQIWLAGREMDRRRLEQLEHELANCAWQESLHTDYRRILLAGVRLLLDHEDELAQLDALRQRLEGTGARRLARQLALILALRKPAHDPDALLNILPTQESEPAFLDYLWLGNACLPAVETLLARPELGQRPAAHRFLCELQRNLTAPVRLTDADTGERPPPAGLTMKEAQILRLIGRHYSNEQIAAALFVSVSTVKTHINHIYHKLGIKSRSQAIQQARILFA